jgi:2-polyprenyl-6-methoxyphenol hydroxylase-like FAD-dependent oxidoreductase
MELEDAVALAECLERAEKTSDIPKALKAFQ